jgi:hypothetical protein
MIIGCCGDDVVQVEFQLWGGSSGQEATENVLQSSKYSYRLMPRYPVKIGGDTRTSRNGSTSCIIGHSLRQKGWLVAGTPEHEPTNQKRKNEAEL